MKKIFLILIMILFFFMAWSCQRVAQESEDMGKLERINLTDVSAIPSEFGKLMSVTSVAEYPRIMQMWFEDSIGTVRVVRVSMQRNKIYEEVLILPRN